MRRLLVQPFVRANLPRVRHGSGGGHGHGGHHEPKVPYWHEKVGRALLISTYLWIFWRLKEDKGQLFGLYKPWEHEHEHHDPHHPKEIVRYVPEDDPTIYEDEILEG